MALVSASRFAVLAVEDYGDGRRGQKSKQKSDKTKSNTSKKDDLKQKPDDKKKKQNATKRKSGDKKGSGIDQELKNMAFGIKTTKTSSKSKETNKKQNRINQQHIQPAEDPEWRKRNEEAESRMFEEDIQEAILLSKIDYEEKREFYEAMRQETEEAKLAAKKKKKQAKKEKASSTMTLDAFNSLSPTHISKFTTADHISEGNETKVKHHKQQQQQQAGKTNSNFFKGVEQDAKKTLTKEKQMESVKKRELHVSVDVRLLQLQHQLENKDLELQSKENEIHRLTVERDKFKEEHAILKKMNTKLLSLLADEKMKEKYDALIQVEELNKEKDELTQEIAILHGALEQERSKVHSLQQTLRTQSNRKDFK